LECVRARARCVEQQQKGDVTTSRIGDGTVLARPH
jgi:hypothetical protein